jgi:hypothetical protein
MPVTRESRAAVFARHAQLVGLMVLGYASLAFAERAGDQIAELSDDFLEYLGSMEGGEENWTDFMSDGVGSNHDVVKPAASPVLKKDNKPAVSSSSSSTASAMSRAASTSTGKADQ